MNEIEVLIHQYDKHGVSEQRKPLSVTMSELERNALAQFESELRCKRTELVHAVLDAVVNGNLHFALNNDNPDIIELFTLTEFGLNKDSAVVKTTNNQQQVVLNKQQQIEIESLKQKLNELNQELSYSKSQLRHLENELKQSLKNNQSLEHALKDKQTVQEQVTFNNNYTNPSVTFNKKAGNTGFVNDSFQEVLCTFTRVLLNEKRQLLKINAQKDELINLLTKSYIPDVNQPVVKEPAVNEPVVNEPVVKEPAVNEPVVNEPVVNEPVVNEPVVNEPVVKGMWAATYGTDCELAEDGIVKVHTSNSFYLLRSCLSVLEYVSLLNKDSTQLKTCVESLASLVSLGAGVNNLEDEMINNTLEKALGYVQDIYKKINSFQ
jgi:hypothetical protein